MITLLLSDAVDIPHMTSDWENTLPASDGIGADDGMDCLEVESDILGCTTGLAVELKAAFLGDLLEVGLSESPSEAL